MKDTKINLCDTCQFFQPECPAAYKDVEFGNGFGNDNIIGCRCFKHREVVHGDE